MDELGSVTGVGADGLVQVPLVAETDLTLGGRWVSLRSQPEGSRAREWLWSNHAELAARAVVNGQTPFVDAGGGEECFPSLRTPYDHGLVWNRSWHRLGDDDAVEAEGFSLSRTLTQTDGMVRSRYRLTSRKQAETVHAVHFLLDLSPAAELHPGPHGRPVFFNPEPVDEVSRLGGIDALIRSLGSGDRGANCYLLPGCRTVRVVDGPDVLEFTLDGPADLPLGLVVWRNLEGWPEDGPYRSIGIEPAVGGAADLPSAFEGGSVHLRPEAAVEWALTLSAWRRSDGRA